MHAWDKVRKECGQEPILFTKKNIEFLQNIQNSAHNCTRYKNVTDDLQCQTDAFENKEMHLGDVEDDKEEEEVSQPMGYEIFLQHLEKEFNRPIHDKDPNLFIHSMSNFTFKHIRNHGQDACGYRQDLDVPELQVTGEPFVETITPEELQDRQQQQRQRRQDQERRKYGVYEMNALLLKRTIKSHRTVWKGKNIEVRDANGSIKSIYEWSRAGFGTDRKQQRAFEAIIAAFVLTFYNNDGELNNEDSENLTMTASTAERRRYRRQRNALLKLKGNTSDPQLVCLLHGPGGSGKSTVINMVKAYAKSFCDSLNHPFNQQTITVTAMSGVAATLLHGETTHMALGLNKSKFSSEFKADFNDARLVIIDEISFASRADIEKIHECLKVLMARPYKLYGGINIVFSGDYSQLDPVRLKEKVHDSNNIPEFHHALNSFIELDGTHRFQDDPNWGKMLLRFRNGEPKPSDIKLINDKCHTRKKKPPKKIQVATYFNKNRDAINSAIFEDWCKEHKPSDGTTLLSACVILMDNLDMTDSTGRFVPAVSNQVKRFLLRKLW